VPGFRAPSPVSASCNVRIIVTGEFARSNSPREPADLLKNHPYVPTLVIQGDDDQIVPIGASGLMSSKIVKALR
jgi:pimeloyl-ACP methyl ester carboxylesterase